MQATTIDEVISYLEQIIAENTERKSKLAFFAVLYKQVTEQVKEAIEKKEFEDNPRMEKLDVVFANRYLEAYSQYQDGKKPSECWEVAFEAANWFWPIILQQLLLGINAHINLDLGIAAAEVAPGEEIHSLKNDFDKINEILKSMVEGVQSRINKVSPIIGLLDKVAGKFDERLVDFSILIARDGAWNFAKEYALAKPDEHPQLIEKRDASIAWLGRDIRKPGFPVNLIAGFIRLFEWAPVTKVINVLRGQ